MRIKKTVLTSKGQVSVKYALWDRELIITELSSFPEGVKVGTTLDINGHHYEVVGIHEFGEFEDELNDMSFKLEPYTFSADFVLEPKKTWPIHSDR